MSEERLREIVNKTQNTIKSWSPEEKEEFKKRFSKLMSGSGNGMYGKTHSDNTKEKIRQSYTPERLEEYRINNLGDKNPVARAVKVVYEDGSEKDFGTILECANYLNTTTSTLWRHLRNGKVIKKCNNCIVKYKE